MSSLCIALSAQEQARVKARELFYTPPPKITQKASDSQSTIVPLGMRYSLLKRTPEGQSVEVDSDTVFHSGDRLRLRIVSNARGYLYVLMQGSSGTRRVLFPALEIVGGNNLIERNRAYQIPPGDDSQFRFDQAGDLEQKR